MDLDNLGCGWTRRPPKSSASRHIRQLRTDLDGPNLATDQKAGVRARDGIQDRVAVQTRRPKEWIRNRSVARDEVVFSDPVQHQERCRCRASVGDAVRSARRNRSPRLPRLQIDLLVGVAQGNANPTLQNIKGVTDIRVPVPGNLLGRTDLQLSDSETWALGMTNQPFYVQVR
jgi:hypothetical protein